MRTHVVATLLAAFAGATGAAAQQLVPSGREPPVAPATAETVALPDAPGGPRLRPAWRRVEPSLDDRNAAAATPRYDSVTIRMSTLVLVLVVIILVLLIA